MNRLQPCPECKRHVRASASECPFCAEPISPAPARPLPNGRLTRAAIFASALATSAAACGSGQAKNTDPQPVTSDAGIANTADDGTADASVDPNIDEQYDPRWDRDYDPNAEPMPYGAPPARKRLV
jgi:hypothetical protein